MPHIKKKKRSVISKSLRSRTSLSKSSRRKSHKTRKTLMQPLEAKSVGNREGQIPIRGDVSSSTQATDKSSHSPIVIVEQPRRRNTEKSEKLKKGDASKSTYDVKENFELKWHPRLGTWMMMGKDKNQGSTVNLGAFSGRVGSRLANSHKDVVLLNGLELLTLVNHIQIERLCKSVDHIDHTEDSYGDENAYIIRNNRGENLFYGMEISDPCEYEYEHDLFIQESNRSRGPVCQ